MGEINTVAERCRSWGSSILLLGDREGGQVPGSKFQVSRGGLENVGAASGRDYQSEMIFAIRPWNLGPEYLDL